MCAGGIIGGCIRHSCRYHSYIMQHEGSSGWFVKQMLRPEKTSWTVFVWPHIKTRPDIVPCCNEPFFPSFWLTLCVCCFLLNHTNDQNSRTSISSSLIPDQMSASTRLPESDMALYIYISSDLTVGGILTESYCIGNSVFKGALYIFCVRTFSTQDSILLR